MNETINLRYLTFLSATSSLGGLLFGFDIAIITGAGPFFMRHFNLNDLGLGWAFSALLFGCAIGSFLAGRCTDLYGRKSLLIGVALLFAATSVGTGLAPTFSILVIARFIGGIAVGAASLIAPMYAAEVSPPKLRGRMGSLYQISITSGALTSYAINYCLRDAGLNNWRWMFGTGVLPSVVFFVLLLFAPETPRYLVMSGRPRESFAILERIAGTESAKFQIAEIEASLENKRGAWRELLQPGTRRAVMVSFWLSWLLQLSGINTIVDYAPSIFMSAGWKMGAALFSTVLVGFTCFFSNLLSLVTIDRFGRRPLYVGGSLGMTITLLGLSAAVLMNRFHGAIVLALVLTFLMFFSSCIGPAYWTLVPEIFPNEVRGMAMTVPVLTQWVGNAIVVLFFPVIFHQISKATTFGFLAMMAMAQAIVAWRFVPETKNTPLEEIEAFWQPSKAAVPQV